MVHRFEMRETRGPDLGAVRFVRTVGHEVHAEFTLGGLNGGVNLALRHVKPFGVEFEVMDQRFHGGLHLGPGRRGNLALRLNRFAFDEFHLLKALAHDLHALSHLHHPAQIPVVAIAMGSDGNLEIHLVVAFIRLRPAQIPRQPRAAHHHAGEAEIEAFLLRHDSDIDVALLEDTVLGQQAVDIVKRLVELLGPLPDIVAQLLGQILMHTAGAEIGRVQPCTAGPLAKDHQLFTFLKAP